MRLYALLSECPQLHRKPGRALEGVSSSFYYDIWNVNYLSKIKWDDVTDEIAQRHAVREQKLALELSAAKRERDFYLTKVDKSRALNSIEERMKEKQKVQQESGKISDFPSEQFAAKVI
ncbi:hypothetical protein K7X08_037154 [Anisodus acutangulus]|uniref:Uncharacterized protein n=1 Tax=Anisodus acutangulus TaxID=402998 RepID=A0A9Q1QWL9_9SOLA|nr:hypothetical protein K7X08_037154 [Anisodus acutangulus]